MKLYKIKNWNELFENNRTRDMKSMAWIPVPNKHDGDGYTTLVMRKNGAALLGAWLAILQVASKCDPRGTLLRSGNLPHDSASIARISRLSEDSIKDALEACSKDVDWLTVEAFTTIPHEGAAIPHPTDEEQKGRERKEQKGKEGNGTEFYSSESRAALHWLNEKSGKHFRECESSLAPINARLKESDVEIEGVKKMISRQCEAWKGTNMEEYLRPQTLFGKEKFDGYYASKDLPVQTNESSVKKPKTLFDKEMDRLQKL